MANTVEIVVKGTDQTKGVFKAVAADTKKAGEHAKGMGDGLKLAAAGAGLLAGTKLIGFLRDSIAEGRESQRVNAQTAAVLKSTGGAAHVTADEISRLATKISNKTGIDDEQIQATENMLLTFTNVRNEVGKDNDIFNQATQTATDMSKALGEDGKTAAIQLGKALNDPIKGITALQRVGVTFTEEQKKEIKTLVEHGDKLKAQKIILGELNKEFGGSAAAQATAGEKMATTWKNFKETIGTKLIPILDNLENKLSDVLTFAGDHIDGIVQLGTAIATVITAAKGYQMVSNMASAVKDLSLAAKANPILTIAAAIALIGTALVVAYRHSQEFRDNVHDAFSDVKIWAAETAIWFLDNLVRPILHGFEQILDAAVIAFGWIPGIGGKLRTARDAFTDWRRGVDRALSGLKATINTEQAAMKIRDLRRRIDDIRQNRVPGINANSAAARAEISRLQAEINALYGRTIGINVITYESVVHQTGAVSAGRLASLGTGGVAAWSAPTGGTRGGVGVINEYGPELVKLPNGSMVYPAGQAKGMWDNATKGGSKVTIEINSSGSRVDDMLVELLRKAIRVRGGDVQLVLGR